MEIIIVEVLIFVSIWTIAFKLQDIYFEMKYQNSFIRQRLIEMLGLLNNNDKSILIDIINTMSYQETPTKQSRVGVYRSYLFGVGKDHFAELVISEDAIAKLREVELKARLGIDPNE